MYTLYKCDIRRKYVFYQIYDAAYTEMGYSECVASTILKWQQTPLSAIIVMGYFCFCFCFCCCRCRYCHCGVFFHL